MYQRVTKRLHSINIALYNRLDNEYFGSTKSGTQLVCNEGSLITIRLVALPP